MPSVLISFVATAAMLENMVLERDVETVQESFRWAKRIEEGNEEETWQFCGVGVNLQRMEEEEDEEGGDSKDAVAIVPQTQACKRIG